MLSTNVGVPVTFSAVIFAVVMLSVVIVAVSEVTRPVNVPLTNPEMFPVPGPVIDVNPDKVPVLSPARDVNRATAEP
jgi:hypothetical protein